MRCTICNPRFVDDGLCPMCEEKFLKCLKPRPRPVSESPPPTKTFWCQFMFMFLSEYP